MQLRQYSFGFSATALLLVLTSESVFAFSLTGATNSFRVGQPISALGFEISVQTDRVQPTAQSELTELLDFLNNTSFSQRYEFQKGSQLAGNFNILSNFPCKPEDLCGGFSFLRGGVGANFDLTFTPSGRDPSLSPNLYWIQWVSVDYTRRYPNYEFIDIYIPAPINNPGIDPNTLSPHPAPYYPAIRRVRLDPMGNPAFYFLDIPYHQNFAYNHDWDFQLYLAEENLRTDAQTGETYRHVTVYNGISWGWTNTRTPLSPPGGGGGGGGGTGGGGTTSSFRDRPAEPLHFVGRKRPPDNTSSLEN